MCLLSFSIPAIIKQKEKKLKEIKQSLKSQINCEASKNYEVKLRESQETNRERERERKQSFPPKLTDNSLTNSLPRTTAFCLYITQLINTTTPFRNLAVALFLRFKSQPLGGLCSIFSLSLTYLNKNKVNFPQLSHICQLNYR